MIRIKRNEPAPVLPKRFRGATRGTAIMVRLQPDDLATLDRHRGALSRPEVIRRLLRLSSR